MAENPKSKISPELLDLLNKAIARELKVYVQYMWQYLILKGNHETTSELKEIAYQELKHAEVVADRVVHFGEVPTTKSDPVTLGRNLHEMVSIDQAEEAYAVDLYKKTIKLAEAEGDETSAKMFKWILGEEEDHLKTFTRLMEESKDIETSSE